MSGLLALLDDVAAITKVAAASVDDIAGQAVKSGAKAAGAVIDDAAVTPKYVQGFSPARELPIVGKIALGSVFNKLVILLPAALLLSSFAAWAIMPLLMLGGAYLCFEGAEKVHHVLFPPPHAPEADAAAAESAAHLEKEQVKGAIKTDFILSAEIMTIALAQIPESPLWFEAVVLAVVGIVITLAVYGSVALIVKADDIGLHMAENSGSEAIRRLGRAIVRGMPGFLKLLTIVGTAAMIWVGGAIVLHGLETLGLAGPAHWIAHAAEVAAEAVGVLAGLVHWAVTAFFDGIAGLVIGTVVLLIVSNVSRLFGKRKAAH